MAKDHFSVLKILPVPEESFLCHEDPTHKHELEEKKRKE